MANVYTDMSEIAGGTKPKRDKSAVDDVLSEIELLLNEAGIRQAALDARLEPVKATSRTGSIGSDGIDEAPSCRCPIESRLWEIGLRIRSISDYTQVMIDSLRI